MTNLVPLLVLLQALQNSDNLLSSHLELQVLTTAGSPLEGGRVSLSGSRSAPDLVATSGPDGRVTFEDVSFGKRDLKISLLGFETRDETISIYQPRLSLRLGLALGHPHATERFSVKGIVRVSKTKLKSDMWVRLVPLYSGDFLEDSVNQSGSFQVTGVDPGYYVLLLLEGKVVIATKSVEVTSNGQPIEIEVK